jgi:hypothetical protein
MGTMREHEDDLLDDAIVLPSAINVLIGLWLVFSPFLLDYGPDDPHLSAILAGAALAFFAYLRAARAARTPLLSWANVVLGAWLVVSGFVLQSELIPSVNESLMGGVALVLALASALTRRD